MKSTVYPLYSPVSPSISIPCFTVCHHILTGLYDMQAARHFNTCQVSPECPLTNELNFVTHQSKGFDLRTTKGLVFQRLQARIHYVHMRHLTCRQVCNKQPTITLQIILRIRFCSQNLICIITLYIERQHSHFII